MKNIASVEDIKNINVLLPSKEEQERILQEIESRLSVCDKLEETVEQSLNKIKYLRQSILKKAFEGNLVPQNPEDEPVEKLLERIKQEKEKFELNKKKRK
jgi:type I restriction enzyme S subunit